MPPRRPGTALTRLKWGVGTRWQRRHSRAIPPLSTVTRAPPRLRHHDGLDLDAASERPPVAPLKCEATSLAHWLLRCTWLQCADTDAGTSLATSWKATRRGLDHESDVRDVRERLAIR
jgi:hypothetical protein